MRTNYRSLLLLILLFMSTSLACSVPGISESPPTPTPESVDGSLSFSVPVPGYTTTLNPGDRVPGARLEYLGREGDIYKVLINGQPADKRLGDSFAWAGTVGPGVFGEYNLRLTTTLPGLGALPITGGVRLTIFDWNPVELSFLPDVSDALHIGNILIDYSVPVGESIPGTLLVYDGIFQQGNTNFAQLSGTSSHPYFAQGDSLVWTGQLRDNVIIRYNLRVLSLSEDRLHVTGFAEIWIQNPTYR